VALRPVIKRSGLGIQRNLCSENQLCVPTVTINGESYRLKDKRKAGLVPKPAKSAKEY
jgi:hypothetical protein